jgi:hypothetical protein
LQKALPLAALELVTAVLNKVWEEEKHLLYSFSKNLLIDKKKKEKEAVTYTSLVIGPWAKLVICGSHAYARL